MHPQLRIYRLFQKWCQLRLNLLRELLFVGVPIGVSITFKYDLVLIMTYLMGTDVLAAHQIGMSFATTARVGQWLGWQNLEGIRRAGFVSSGIVIGGQH